MTTEWELAFLSIALLIFCLIYSLNIPHSNKNPSFFLLNVQVSLYLKNLNFGDISPYGSENNFGISFRVIFTIVTRDGNTNYIETI